jgi:hypothetical protein
MTNHSKLEIELEIDETLRRLRSVEPPPGLEQRVHLRLQNTPRRFSLSVTRSIAAAALAAGVALSAVLLNPGIRSVVIHNHASAQSTPVVTPPRAAAPLAGFGTAAAVHVPVEPVPVQPTPVNQGRGRSRSGRATLPGGVVAPLPRGVAPHPPVTAVPASSTTEPSQ